MKLPARPFAAALVVAFATLPGLHDGLAQAKVKLPSTNLPWQAAASDADIDRAFARARAENKPVLLYWGATWCPPCNQLKATLFSRQDFAALSKHFIAVHVDGDRPGAQRLGARFKVSGYPSTVLFTPLGQEITRLPGDVDPPQALAILQQGLSGGRSVKAVLADALAGRPLAAGDWKLLAFYGWPIDEAQVIPRAEVPGTLALLAARHAALPDADTETSHRLWLQALAASDAGQGLKPDEALRQRVLALLADATAARQQAELLAGESADIVRALEPDDGPRRTTLVAAYDAALRRLQADGTLSRGDRLSALIGRIELARLAATAQPKDAVQVSLPAPLLAEVRAQVQRDDREITDGYERQAVITAAAHALGRAGLWADSDALLQANMAKSHSPYYLMSQLGSNLRKQGRKDEALKWYQQSFEQATGPATRLQWGSGYLNALVDLAPEQGARIEKLAAQLFREAAQDRGAFEGRSARSLQRAGAKLVAWNGDGKQAAALKRLQAQLSGVCAKVEAAEGRREACQAVLKPAAKAG